MPRGFLIKRTKKTVAVSYRVREDGSPTQTLPVPVSAMPCCMDRVLSIPETFPLDCDQVQSIQSRISLGGMPEAHCPPSLSPNRPTSGEYLQKYHSLDYLDRKLNSRSPVQAESFPESSFTIRGSPLQSLPSLAEMTTKLGAECSEREPRALKRPAHANNKAKQTNSKKHKPSCPTPGEKKLSYRDEVTTSPVLGLRIKENPEEDAKPRSNSPLGEFICQLCKERYSDPLTLAQHKCSRIVRVDYRCTECEKVFSCPANLASHRRWHKPRSPKPEGNQEEVSLTSVSVNENRNIVAPDPGISSLPPSDSGSEEELPFSCPRCSKKFRRQAYLRKHMALHKRESARPQQHASIAEEKAKPNQEAVKLSSPAEHSPLYLARDSPAAEVQAIEAYACRFCGDNCFSSPGLVLHVNKCHPTESRQVIVLSHTT